MALAVLLVAWFMGDDFRIQAVQVQNNHGVPVSQIVGASGLVGEHAMLTDLDAAARRVDDLPGVDAVRVTCVWPANCVILVQASQALAIWQIAVRAEAHGAANGSAKVWVDRQGKVQRALGDIPAQLTVNVEDGELPVIGVSLDARLLRGLSELQALLPQVTRYSYSGQYGLMFTDQRGWRVRLGVSEREGAMSQKLQVMRQLSAQLVAKRITPKVLDVRFVTAPYYVK
jgi:cell division septal protein FtsQ